jgi:hypothetical protein
VIQIGLIESGMAIAVFVFTIGVSWGSLKMRIRNMTNALDTLVIPDLKEIREKFGSIETKVDTLWKDKFAPANSPRQLNQRGNNILDQSGIKSIVEEKRQKIIDLVKKRKPGNAFDAEASILTVVKELPDFFPEIIEDLKTGAFRVGTDIDAVLFVGAMHVRNEIFQDLGFSLEDLDKPKV